MIDTDIAFARAPLLDVLLDSEQITFADAAKAEQLQAQKSMSVEEALVESTSITSARIAETYAKGYDVPLMTELPPQALIKDDPMVADTPIIFFTAVVSRQEARQTMGAHRIIAKPVLMDEQLQVIEQEIARQG